MNQETEETSVKKDKRFHLSIFQGTALAGLVIMLLILIYALIRNSSVYTSYEVTDTWSRSDSTSAYYQVVDSGMLRYSKDGAAMTDSSGNIKWNQIYEMSTPILDVADEYYAIGDFDGNSIYIFTDSGLAGHITTDLPIQDIEVSDKGVVAAILSDSDSNYVNIYDIDGNILGSIKASFENTGYPLTVAISSNATKLVVSYLCFEDNAVSTRIIFYSFSNTDGDHVIDKLLYTGLYPKVEFLNNSRVAVYGEYGFNLYSFGSTVGELAAVEFEDEIQSVFAGNQKMGFIFKNQDENGKYRMDIYDIAGKKNTSIYFDLDYDYVSADDDEIILYNDMELMVYQYSGKLRFHTTFGESITGIMPSWEDGMYWLICENTLKEIRIK